MVEVTRADRDAAKRLMDMWEDGDLHCDDFVEAFATHRISALREAAADPTVVERAIEAMYRAEFGGNIVEEVGLMAEEVKALAQAALTALIGEGEG